VYGFVMGMEFSFSRSRQTFVCCRSRPSKCVCQQEGYGFRLPVVLGGNYQLDQGMTACTSFEYELSLAEESTAVTT
jgi:hypothetical protein